MKSLETEFCRVALRYGGIYVDVDREELGEADYCPTLEVMGLLEELARCGYTLTEEAMHALSRQSPEKLMQITVLLRDIFHLDLNWAPLVADWQRGIKACFWDYVVTDVVNNAPFKNQVKGTHLPCGHVIPDGRFNLNRYNGCPYCGTPFRLSDTVLSGETIRLKELKLMAPEDMLHLFKGLVKSPVALDATQFDSLQILIMGVDTLDMPKGSDIPVRQNRIVVAAEMVRRGLFELSGEYLESPADVLRYIWFIKLGRADIIPLKVLLKRAAHWKGIFPQGPYYGGHTDYQQQMADLMKLKFSRSDCRIIAEWLNSMEMTPEKMAEVMHPQREIWVRMIRAARLAEYARRKGFVKLARLTDIFYRGDYDVWQGRLDRAQRENDAARVLAQLKTRPGLFARALYSTMLRFGAEPVIQAFKEVAMQVPARLMLSLLNASESYFDVNHTRYGSSILGKRKDIGRNPKLLPYSDAQLTDMQESIKRLFLENMSERYRLQAEEPDVKEAIAPLKGVWIAPELFDIPFSVGDRAATIQGISCYPMGTRFKVEGDKVRLFLHWGKGMPAQHLDLDLSATVIYFDLLQTCSFSCLEVLGAKHSGDIRSIPDQVGTAEYIELNIPELREAGARFVTFHSFAYSDGALCPATVGWMNAASPMIVHENTGVAYDPATVQQMVAIPENLVAKGLTFGLLDVTTSIITWLELPNDDQVAEQVEIDSILGLLDKLRNKISVGTLLALRAKAQGLPVVDKVPEDPSAIYAYPDSWASDPANLASLLP